MAEPAGGRANPLLDGLRIEPAPAPATLVIFGASGDLTRRKLLPAVYHLSRGQRLPARFHVIGVARTPMTDDQFRQQFHDCLKEFAGLKSPDEVSAAMARELTYLGGEMDDPALYDKLSAAVKARGDGGVLFYLAIPPSVYGTVVERLSAASLTKQAEPAWRRIIVEKPFGSDLATAQALNRLLHAHVDESQVFRIDHYLGKETVQNLLVFR